MERQCAELRVAFLVEDGFAQDELAIPRQALSASGAVPLIISSRPHMVRGRHRAGWGDLMAVDLSIARADTGDFDALVLLGGPPDAQHQRNRAVQRLIAAVAAADRPLAAIGRGALLLIAAGVARGRRLTSSLALRAELLAAGAEWVDEAVVVDRQLITARDPTDPGRFARSLIRELAGVPNGR